MNRKLLFILTAGTLVIGGCAASIRPLRTLPRRVASGDTGSFTAQVSSLDTITANNKPTGTQITFDETYTTSQQMTKGNSQTLTVDLPDNYYLTGLTLSMHSNSKGGAGTLTINNTQIISGTFSSSSWHGSWSQSFVNVVVNNNAFTNLVKNNDVNEFTIVLAATANSLYCESYTLSWGYYEDTNIYHTVSFNALGGGSFDARQVIEGEGAGELPAPTKAKDEENQKRYQFLGWYALSNTDNPANPTFEGATEYTASTPIMSDVTLYAKYQEISYYKVIFNSNGGSSVATQEIDAGQKANEPAAPTKENDNQYSYSFVGWYKEAGFINIYNFNDLVNENITLHAKWNQSLIPAKNIIAIQDTNSSLSYSNYQRNTNNIKDTLTRAFTGVSVGTSYSSWSNKTGASGVKYAGNSAGSNNTIQLRSTDNAGIIVTSNSGLTAKSIKVTWNSSTTAGRVLQIFGKDTAYTQTSNLYNDNYNGDLETELAYSDAVDYQIIYQFEHSYQFVGIKSKSGAQYIDSIEIEWQRILYTYENLAIRFGGRIDADLWTRLDTESSIQGYGVLLSTYEYLNAQPEKDLKNYYASADGTNVKKFTNADTYPDHELKAEPTLKDGYRVWNLYKQVRLEDATKDYVGVAFIQINGEVVFLNSLRTSVKKLAQQLIAGPDRDENSLGGSLNYLANL